jgi:hypothetical protein
MDAALSVPFSMDAALIAPFSYRQIQVWFRFLCDIAHTDLLIYKKVNRLANSNEMHGALCISI